MGVAEARPGRAVPPDAPGAVYHPTPGMTPLVSVGTGGLPRVGALPSAEQGHLQPGAAAPSQGSDPASSKPASRQGSNPAASHAGTSPAPNQASHPASSQAPCPGPSQASNQAPYPGSSQAYPGPSQVSNQASHQASNQAANQASHQASTQGSTQGSTQASTQGSTQASHQASSNLLQPALNHHQPVAHQPGTYPGSLLPADCSTVASAIATPHPIPDSATLIHTAGSGKPPRLMVYEHDGARMHRHHLRPARRQEKLRTMLKDLFRRHHEDASSSASTGSDGESGSSRSGSRASSRAASPDPAGRALKKSDSEEMDRDAADAVAFANRGSKPPSLLTSMAQQLQFGNADPDALINEALAHQNTANGPSLADRYGQLSSVLGKGSFGVVRLAQRADPTNKNRKLVYAVKEFHPNASESQPKFLKRLISEFYLASSLHHQNIIQTLDLLKDGTNKYCGVMEFCAGGDLYSLIVVAGRLESTEADCFFKQIMRGVAYMHERGVAHRDLKPENVLLTSRGCCKITDFGNTECFRMAGEKQVHLSTSVAGSGPYIAPEEYKKQEFDPRAVDIWAVGVIYMAMSTGRHLWHEAKHSDEFYVKYLTGRKDEHGYEPIERLKMPKRRNVIYSVLDPVASRRLTAKQVLNSEWGREIVVCAAGEGEP